jgi:hypothetical protein
MDAFLADYDAGRSAGRYIDGALPNLAFASDAFDLALVSHLLFLYSSHLDEAFHVRGVLELLRVARELRIFPLVDLNAHPSPHVAAVVGAAENAGFACTIVEVDYEVQKGAHSMLRIRRH